MLGKAGSSSAGSGPPAGMEEIADTAGFRHAAGEAAAFLLRETGAGHVSAIVGCLDTARLRLPAGPHDPTQSVLGFAATWLGRHQPDRPVRTVPRVEPTDRLAALLWGTHGGLPPQISDAVVLRCLCALPLLQSAEVLGVPRSTVEVLIGRAARRTRAMGLGRSNLGPVEYRFGLRTAATRLRMLGHRTERLAGPPGDLLRSTLIRWLDISRHGGRVHSWASRRRIESAPRSA